MTSPTGAFRVASGYIEVVGKVNDRSVKQSADAAGNVITDSGKKAGQRAGDEIGRGLEDGTKKGAGKAGDRLMDGVKPGAKRAGDTIADEADRGGREGGRRGGEELGKGVQRGGEGAGSRLRGILGQAGQGAGGAFGDTFMGKVGMLATAGGLLELGKAVGGIFMDGFAKAIEQQNIGKLLIAKTGTSEGDARQYGKLAGDLYAKGFGESVAQVGDALTQVIQSGVSDLMEDASFDALGRVAGDALNVAQILGEDVKPVLRDVATLLRTGMAKDAKEAFDILVKGEQSGANAADDLLDTLQEYPAQFEKLGVKGPQAIGLISQAMRAGARSSDLAADALKEFSIRAIDGSKSTSDGFKMLGLDAKKMADDIAAGGTRANGALDLTLDRLRGIKDPVQQSQAAVALFGTQAEDLGKSLLAMDPSNAVDALGKVEDAAKKAGDQIDATNFEKFKRGMEQDFVGYMNDKAIPAMDEWRGAFKGFTNWLNDSFGPDTSSMLADAFTTPPITPSKLSAAWKGTKDFFTKTIPGWFDGPKDALTDSWDGVKDFFTDTVPGWFSGVGDAAGELPGKVGDALSELPDKLRDLIAGALDDMAYAAGYGLGTVVGFFRDLPGNIWDAVTGLPEKLGDIWDGAWDFAMPKVRSGIDGTLDFFRNLPGNILDALKDLGRTLSDIFSAAWDWARAAVRWHIGLLKWEIGNLPSALWNMGDDIIDGLINGIENSGWKLWDLAKRLAGNFLGGFRRAFDSHSPSRVMDKIGEHEVGAGLIQGLDKAGAKLPANAKKMADGFVTPFKGALVDVKTPRMASAAGGTSDTPAAAGSLGPYVIQIGDRQFASFVIDAVTGAPKQVAAAVDEGRRQRGFVDTARARR